MSTEKLQAVGNGGVEIVLTFCSKIWDEETCAGVEELNKSSTAQQKTYTELQ